MCTFNKLYGIDTKGIRVFNIYYHSIWLILLLGHITEIVSIDLPDSFEPKINLLVWIILLCIYFSILSLTSEGRRRILMKYISLVLGSLIQLIIAYKYVMVYPPLTPMVIISSIISLWFIGASLYIKKINKENMNGNSSTTDSL